MKVTSGLSALVLAILMLTPHGAQGQGGGRALAERVSTLESLVETLQAQVAALQDTLRFVTVEDGELDGLAGPHLIVTGANVHIRSGSEATDDGGATPLTGLGNLIVGYNEPPPGFVPGERAGAHNLVVGPRHRYPNTGGFVAGFENRVSGISASVSGGGFNTASGTTASVSGGADNVASGFRGSVSGGAENQASGTFASASGGLRNTVSGRSASVGGGRSNTASGEDSSVSGGFGAAATGLFDWRAGSLFQD